MRNRVTRAARRTAASGSSGNTRISVHQSSHVDRSDEHCPHLVDGRGDHGFVGDLVLTESRSLVLGAHGPYPVTAAVDHPNRATASATASATTDHDSARSVISRGASSDRVRDRRDGAVGVDHRAVDRLDPASQHAGRCAQRALRERQSDGGNGGDDRGDADGVGLRDVRGDTGNAPQLEREAEIGVHEPAEPLEVVREREHRADDHERQQHPTRPATTPTTPMATATASPSTAATTSALATRSSVRSGRPCSSSSACGGDADRGEERDQRREQACAVDVRCEARTDDDVAQVPRGVRRVEDRPPVAPGHRAWRCSTRAGARARSRAVPSGLGAPHHEPAAEAHRPGCRRRPCRRSPTRRRSSKPGGARRTR